MNLNEYLALHYPAAHGLEHYFVEASQVAN